MKIRTEVKKMDDFDAENIILRGKLLDLLLHMRSEWSRREEFDNFEALISKGMFSHEDLKTTKEEVAGLLQKYKERKIEDLNRYLKEMQEEHPTDIFRDRIFMDTMALSRITYAELKTTEKKVRKIFKQYYKTCAGECLQDIINDHEGFLNSEHYLKEFLKKGEISLDDLEFDGAKISELELNGYIKIRCLGKKVSLTNMIDYQKAHKEDYTKWQENLVIVNKRLEDLEVENLALANRK